MEYGAEQKSKFYILAHAGVAELAYAHGSEPCSSRIAGSNPAFGTTNKEFNSPDDLLGRCHDPDREHQESPLSPTIRCFN